MLSSYTYVFRSDIYSYYANIDHQVLCSLLRALIADDAVYSLLVQFIQRIETAGGEFWEYSCGIPMGSPLSPLLGAIALLPLDEAMQYNGIYYVRYMDDWCVLTKTRNQLRKVIKITHKVMAFVKQKLHPLKTNIGKISKGFDF